MKRIALWTAALLALAGCGKSAVAKHDFVVAAHGKLRADIVLSAKPTDVERFAADELADHLAKAVGTRPEIVREGEFVAGRFPFHFFVGRTDAARAAGLADRMLEPEERIVRQVGNGLYFLGGDIEVKYDKIACDGHTSAYGTIYAVYDLLDNEVGVKWLWAGETGTYVPKNPDLAFARIDRSGREPLTLRSMYGISYAGGRAVFGFSNEKTQKAYAKAVQRFFLRHRLGRRKYVRVGHSFMKHYDQYGKEHPEWFQMFPDGTRGTFTDRPGLGRDLTMCVSNPELVKQIVKDNLSVLKSDFPLVNICENDTPGMCACPNCRAWDSKDPRFEMNDYWQNRDPEAKLHFGRFGRIADCRWGESSVKPFSPYPASVSDRYAKFYNAVLKEARKVNPKARVISYAYANYVEGPTETKVDPGVIIDVVPRHYFPYDQEEMDFFRKCWMGWRKAGAKDLGYRPNFLLAGQGFPLDSGRGICEDFAFAFTNGMVGCCFDSYQGNNSVHAMQDYALMRSMREPTRGYAKARADMLQAFGKAAKEIDRYFDYVEAYGRKWTLKSFRDVCHRNLTPQGIPGGGFNRCTYIAGDFYTDAFFDDVYAIFDAAEKAASGDAEVLARIDYLRKGIRASDLARRTRIAQKSGDKAAFAAAFKAMNDYRAQVEGDFIADFSGFASLERAQLGWPHGENK